MKHSQKLRIFCLPFLVALFSNFVFSQSNETEKRQVDSGGGYSFVLPAGFNAKQSEDGFGLVNNEQTVVVAVKSHDFKTFEEFSAQSNLANDGFTLVKKVQDFGEKGKTFLVAKQTPQGLLLVDTFVLFSPFGGGTLIVAFTDKNNNQKGFRAALQIAESVEFTKPQASPATNQWQTFLSGKHLVYFYSSSGFSERTDIYLCPSGTFFYRSDSSSQSGNGSGAVGGSSEGTWKIRPTGGGSLILQFRNGNVREYRLSRRQTDGEIGLNGNRYFVEPQNECQ